MIPTASAIEQFLIHACKRGDKVDLRTKSGYQFERAVVNQVQDGAVELKQTQDRVVRFYVLAIEQIEWAVRSRSQK